MDPNQESLNDLRVRISSSQLCLNPYASTITSRGSQKSLRRSIIQSGSISGTDFDSGYGDHLNQSNPQSAVNDTNLFAASNVVTNEDSELLKGKIQEYLGKLNEILGEYERARVVESALINLRTFNLMLQKFMDLPEVDELIERVQNEPNSKLYKVVSQEQADQIIQMDNQISANTSDTSKLFSQIESVQHLYDAIM